MKFNKVYIEITNMCNLSCSFCSPSHKVKQHMDVDAFAHLISEVKKVTKTIYLHVKGEPLLHPQLRDILAICEKAGMRVNITTNGTLLTKVTTLLCQYPCVKKVNISLHCEQADAQYLENVFTCVETLKQHMSIVYRLWTLADHTLDAMSKAIVAQMVSYYHVSADIKKALHEERNVAISDHLYVDKDNVFDWPSLTLANEQTSGYCYGLKSHLAILVDGSVVPCCLDGEGVITLGNLHTQNMEEIVHSERFLHLKQSLQKRQPCEALCQKCTFKLRF